MWQGTFDKLKWSHPSAVAVAATASPVAFMRSCKLLSLYFCRKCLQCMDNSLVQLCGC
jgi:hypothetical protein